MGYWIWLWLLPTILLDLQRDAMLLMLGRDMPVFSPEEKKQPTRVK